ncbi:myosin class ii heavy chain [Colletotrichum karsti]|uniref:Myosin class ii heavy chain n=1 Tax=Colletotrichum karsti TaxID=1095194 RepID=A0A9P6LGF9_9PEZI|nr:myosin class ii heavy chain [Colletotrichum karsti]KAF9871545.1 myosin class ii heavy chain [Colletotrichum karsti]
MEIESYFVAPPALDLALHFLLTSFLTLRTTPNLSLPSFKSILNPNPTTCQTSPTKTSPQQESTISPPAASAQDGTGHRPPSAPTSPALSSTSTAADGEDLGSSPVLPPLPAPRLPDRARDILRNNQPEEEYVTASWGSPYSTEETKNLARQSFGSDESDGSPIIHHLAIDTPFLRPPPSLSLGGSPDDNDIRDDEDGGEPEPFISAAQVLANRARRPARRLTEDWIRQHTAGENSESRHWFSDGSEHSSLSGSGSADESWHEKESLRTPKANSGVARDPHLAPRHPRARSSAETLKPEDVTPKRPTNMESPELSKAEMARNSDLAVPSTPRRTASAATGETTAKTPITPMRSASARVTIQEPTRTPRIKKKVPWKGKNIMVLLPKDDERGRPGQAPKPLNQTEVEGMFREWQDLGYDISGFDLDAAAGTYQEPSGYSQSRDGWPSFEDMIRERAERAYKVTLPDLNAWKNYVNELNEAKLRALGVSFGDDDPPAPSISPAVSQPSRQASAQYPPLPFSPPLPTSSASSNHAGFPFPSQFMPGRSSHTHSPSIASPVGFGSHPAKYNARQSISVPMGHSPFQLANQPSPLGWGQHRTDSPSMLNGILSPVSPFTPEGFAPTGSPAFNAHQRHQSLQYPMLPHQFMQQQQQPARASPRLQEVREDEEEEEPAEEPKKSSEAAQRNSDDLQAEIDEAEYHLEEQMRNELEHEDYSPHNEEAAAEQFASIPDEQPVSHATKPSVHFPEFVPNQEFIPHQEFVPQHFQPQEFQPQDFQPQEFIPQEFTPQEFVPQEFQPQQFAQQSGDGPVLHHPRPHSRGHSLSQNFFSHHDENRPRNDSFSGWHDVNSQRIDEAAEVETNPSNLGTPVQDFNLATLLQQHQRSFSTQSNPWNDVSSANSSSGQQRRGSHASKPSLSKLNVKAPEFKFNPGHESKTSFTFGAGASNSFQPTVFQAGSIAPSITSPSAQSFGAQSTSSKINAAAPVFSPGQSDFSFSASGPKFRPDAPAFTPFGAVSDSLASPTSGSESIGNHSSIFGNIDLNLSDASKPAKKSKAIPIVRPSSSEKKTSDEDGMKEDADGRPIGGPAKRAKASRGDGDDVPQFAEPSPEPMAMQSLRPASKTEDLDASGHKSGDDQAPTPADTTMSSTVASEQPTDSKAVSATSPSDTSPDQQQQNWAPFEFDSKDELANFNEARPFGIDTYKKGHNKSLSATAKAFTPGGGWGSTAQEDETEEEEEEEDERDREDTIEPFVPSTEAVAPSPREPSPAPSPPPKKVALPRGLGASRFASPPKAKGLAASRFAASPSPAPEPELEEGEIPDDYVVSETEEEYADEPDAAPAFTFGREDTAESVEEKHEPTFEEIDAIMDHLNQNDPTLGVNRSNVDLRYHQASPNRNIQVTHTSPYRLQPAAQYRSGTSSPIRQYRGLPGDSALPSTELEDPFVDPPLSAQSFDAPVTNLNIGSAEQSDWEGAFSDEEQAKLEQRVQFFDGRVNDRVSDLLATRLAPMEKALLSIQQSLRGGSRRASSSVRRSTSAEIQHSDADDEDEEPMPRRSLSPRRDRRMEHIRAAVLDAFAVHQRNIPTPAAPLAASAPASDDTSNAVLRALEEMKEQFGTSMRLDFRGEDLRNIVEEAVEKRMPTPSQQPTAERESDEAVNNKLSELQAKVMDLEERLYAEQTKVEKEVTERRGAEDLAAELERKLQAAETRVEIEIMNRSIFDNRIGDLEEKLRQQEERAHQELDGRRTAEDRLSEVQRLLRIATEEENRLREVVDDREHKIKAFEQSSSNHLVQIALMEAAQTNATQAQTELTNKINHMDDELRATTQEANRWRSEAERVIETARRQQIDLNETVNENKQLQKFLDTLGTQLQENERVRESWRAKFVSLQEDMAQAARDITEENARRTKREQALVARQEVLDAKLQAEARTRERIETELERLESGERQGMRAVNECKRLEGILGEMKTENHKLHQTALQYKREFEEARESGASEVQRTRLAMQHEIDQANHHVNVVREELEEQIAKLRADNDQLTMDMETSKAQSEMMAEAAQSSETQMIEELKRKHQNEVEDIQARWERQLNNAVEDAQKTEQHLLERLSLSTSKTEHLQDRVAHLEEKVEIAREAARAAVQAAKSAGVEPSQPIAAIPAKAAATVAVAAKSMELPEKISPQALRESIMVLQEQLQAREQRIEELESTVDKLDPEAPAKITKRDDEITWLRELLAVRHGDLQDIIQALSAQDFDKEAVKDAAIRLKANLQMEEQERERAMNGGSAINLPNIAQSLREAATPRVAQAVGPLAAAWGNWRKSQAPSSRAAARPSSSRSAFNSNHTPSRSTVSTSSNNNLLGGLLTPPASGLRQTPPTHADEPQPTAFQTTGRRYTAQQLQAQAQAHARGPSVTNGQPGFMSQKSPPLGRPSSRQQPMTPPMMRSSAYDSDAHPGDFDDHDFFED